MPEPDLAGVIHFPCSAVDQHSAAWQPAFVVLETLAELRLVRAED